MPNAPRNDPGGDAPLSILLARLDRELTPKGANDVAADGAAVREVMVLLPAADHRRAWLALLSDAAVGARGTVGRSLIDTVVFGGAIAVGLLVGAQVGYWTAPSPRARPNIAESDSSASASNRAVSIPLDPLPESERAAIPAAIVPAAGDAPMPEASTILTASVPQPAKRRVARRSGRELAAAFAFASPDASKGAPPSLVSQGGVLLAEAPADLPNVAFSGIVDLSRLTYSLAAASVPVGPFDTQASANRALDGPTPAMTPPAPDLLAEGMMKASQRVHVQKAERERVRRPVRQTARHEADWRPRAEVVAKEVASEKPRRAASKQEVSQPSPLGHNLGNRRLLRIEKTPSGPVPSEQASSWMPSTLVGQ